MSAPHVAVVRRSTRLRGVLLVMRVMAAVATVHDQVDQGTEDEKHIAVLMSISSCIGVAQVTETDAGVLVRLVPGGALVDADAIAAAIRRELVAAGAEDVTELRSWRIRSSGPRSAKRR